MTPNEVQAMLETHQRAQISTLMGDGGPHMSTVSYGLLDGNVAFWTLREAQKIKNLQRDPRVACLVEDGIEYTELRGVLLRGTAELVEDMDGLVRIGEAKLANGVGGADFRSVLEGGRRVGIIIHAEHTASWDFGKHGRTGAVG